MKYHLIFLFVFALSATACHNEHGSRVTRIKTDPATANPGKNVQNSTAVDTSRGERRIKDDSSQVSSKILYFQFQNDTLAQNLQVSFLSKTQVHFMLASINKKRGEQQKIQGNAILPNGLQDTEEDNDENGMAYASNEFVYHNDGCWLYLRIDADSTNKIQIKKVKWPGMTLYCPYYSIGVMRAVSKTN